MTASTTPSTTARLDCLCGCGQDTSAKANYRPGHDAAHVSALLADIAAHGDLSTGAVREYAKALPSDALRVKFSNAVDKLAAKASNQNKAPQPAKADEFTYREVAPTKIGRWEYPAREVVRDSTNEYYRTERNTKRDGSGEWIDAEGN